MITLMIGRAIDQLYPPRTRTAHGRVLLEAEGLTAPGVIKDVGFSLHAGEILGLFGLMGSGRTELARILFGLDGFDSRARSQPAAGRAADDARARPSRRGMAFVTENRREEGLLMNGAIADNIALAALPRFWRTKLGIVDETRLASSARPWSRR